MISKAIIPNALTMGNLLGGAYVCWMAASGGDLSDGAVALVWLGAMFCDVLDGFVARKLGVDGPMGVQLDSLADVVTGGLAPAFVAFSLLKNSEVPLGMLGEMSDLTCALPWLLAVAAAYRLARYNVSAGEASLEGFFEGLPAPASGVFWAGMMVWQGGELVGVEHTVISIASVMGLALLPIFMVLKRKFFALKGWGKSAEVDRIRKAFLAVTALVIAGVFIAGFNVFAAAPLCVLLYSCFALVLTPNK